MFGLLGFVSHNNYIVHNAKNKNHYFDIVDVKMLTQLNSQPYQTPVYLESRGGRVVSTVAFHADGAGSIPAWNSENLRCKNLALYSWLG